MKKIFMVILVLFTALSIMTLAQAQTITWDKAHKSAGWDPVTKLNDGTTLPTGDVIKYQPYLRNQATGAITAFGSEITAATVTFTFPAEGRYLMGVKAIRYAGGTTNVGESVVSWSDIVADAADITGDNIGDPFGFEYYVIPGAPKKIRALAP